MRRIGEQQMVRLYIVTQRSYDLSDFDVQLKTNELLSSPFYMLCTVTTNNTDKVIDYFVSNAFEFHLILPVLSDKLADIIGVYDWVRYNSNCESYIAENILADYLHVLPEHNSKTKYIDNMSISQERVEKYNVLSKESGLYISTEYFKPKISELFVKSIVNVVNEEKEVENPTFEQLKEMNKNFFKNVEEDFLLRANIYYTADEIKEFVDRRLLNEQNLTN